MSAQTDFIASIYWSAKNVSDKTGLSLQTTLAQAQQERVRYLSEYRAARLRLLANAGHLGYGALGE